MWVVAIFPNFTASHPKSFRVVSLINASQEGEAEFCVSVRCNQSVGDCKKLTTTYLDDKVVFSLIFQENFQISLGFIFDFMFLGFWLRRVLCIKKCILTGSCQQI